IHMKYGGFKMENDVNIKEQTPAAARRLPRVKGYIIVIVYAVLAAVIAAAYICGASRDYDSTRIEKAVNEKKSSYDELIEAEILYEDYTEQIETLNAEIADIQAQIDTVADFESKQESYNSEIQGLSDQVSSLTAQKSEKEQTLTDIENELSQY
ncbi:MAG: hypothetical protein LUF26_03640, partial [Firmicutes bacterium]|nr:hypothetical protein [Bacillota bacterium]